jgi:CPA2 family monovalent cation:H+ antiporter-2
MTDTTYQWLVVTAVATIGVTPFMLRGAPKLVRLLNRLPFGERREARREAGAAKAPLENHLVIVGYGVNGRNVARAAQIAGVPYTAVDMNPTLVAAERARGVPIHYGDSTRQALLEHLGVRHARAVVIVLSDAAATRQVTALVRSMNVGCTIVARTRYVREVEALKELGADTVIPEELETSVEIVSRVLASYLVPRREIESFVSEIRAGGYETNFLDLKQTLTDLEIATLRVDPGSPIDGQRLVDSDLRRVYGVTVIAIRRGEDVVLNPGGNEVVRGSDLLVVFGLGEELAAANELLVAPSPGA